MDVSTIIDYIVLISVIIVLIHAFKYLYLDLFIYGFQMPIFGSESLIFYDPVSSTFRTFFSILVSVTTPPLIYILVFYLLFYLLYLLFIWILDQGWLFFIHPLVQPLLSISPFNELIKYGVFKLIEGILSAFGISTLIGAFYKVYISVYIFSNENIRYIFNFIAPGLGDKVIEYMDKYKGKKADLIKQMINEERENKKENKDEDKLKAIEQINLSVKASIANKIKPITPDLDVIEKNNIYLKNNKEIINAYSKKIGDYIKLSY